MLRVILASSRRCFNAQRRLNVAGCGSDEKKMPRR
jgi:hypothetical protein